jgi:hypothetical protein
VPEPAVVVVADASGERAAACRWHWNDMLRASGAVIRMVTLAPEQLALW